MSFKPFIFRKQVCFMLLQFALIYVGCCTNAKKSRSQFSSFPLPLFIVEMLYHCIIT